MKDKFIHKNRNQVVTVLFLYFCAFFALSQSTQAQEKSLEELTYEEYLASDTLKPARLTEWTIDLLTLDTLHLVPDTLQDNFYNYNPIFRSSISNNYLGNLGSPYQSNIFFNRPQSKEFVFLDVYRDYALMPEDVRFVNTVSPYTNLGYFTGGARTEGEDELIVKHSQNFGPDFNITGMGDYIYGRGMYDETATKHLAVSFHASYIRPRYSLHAIATSNSMENFESGGLSDDRYVNDPFSVTDSRGVGETSTFPVELSGAISSTKNKYLLVSNKYNLGYHKDMNLADTVLQNFVPVTSITHTLKVSSYRRQFTEESADNYFENHFINKETNDSVSRNIFSNTLSINLREGLNKFVPFGLAVFLENDIVTDGNNSWHHLADSSWSKPYVDAQAEIDSLSMGEDRFLAAQSLKNYRYSNTAIGGRLFRQHGSVFNIDALGKLYFQGYKQGDYTLKGKMTSTFGALDSLLFWAKADFSRSTPDRFLQQYYSNHFWWNNDFDAKFEERIEAGISFPKYSLDANLKISTINNYIYFDREALPQQFSDGIQIAAFELNKTFRMGRWVWDNKLAYQLSSNDSIIPLPDLALYSNIFYYNTAAKVLNFQLGAKVNYHTAFAAQAYMPATGRFYMQDEVEIGNYPMVNVYANFHIKRMRFFLMFYHVNYSLGTREYFSAPHYANNQRFFKLGISWNFYD